MNRHSIISVLILWAFVPLVGSGGQELDLNMRDAGPENIDRLWDYSNPAESETRFRELLTSTEGAKNAETRVEILTQIARAQGLQRNFDDAHATLGEAELLLSEDMSVGKIRIALERGRVRNSSGDAPGSRVFFEQALALADEAGQDYYAVDAAHMLGIVTEPADQLTWNLRAVKMAEAASDERARMWLGPLYNNIGWSYHDLEDYESALATLQNALDWYEGNGTEQQVRIGEWSVAKILRLLGRVEEALEGQRVLADQLEAAGETDGYVFEELGECYLALGDRDKARPNFARAHSELSKDAWLVANEPDRIERLKELGGVED